MAKGRNNQVPISGWRDKMWSIHTMENYLSTERNQILIHTTFEYQKHDAK